MSRDFLTAHQFFNHDEKKCPRSVRALRKKIILGALAVVFLCSVSANESFAKSKNQIPVVDKVNEVNVFNKVSDYFATLGETDTQKAAIRNHRRQIRRTARLKALQIKKQKQQRKREEEYMNDLNKVKGLR